jgi:Aerotolerance regulator N-terminal/CARDB
MRVVSFLSGLFLWALPLAAIPLVIHLLHRRRRQVVPWGAMQLLLESVPTKRRIWHLNDLLLMLMRALVLAALVLAFARPQIRSGLLTGRAPGREVILILDSSLSTGRLQAGVPVFEQIRGRAREMLDRLGASDRVRLMLAGSVPRWLDDNPSGQPATDRRIGERLATLKPTLATADMTACVHAALSSEIPSDATSRLIVILTDGAAHGWSAESIPRWQAIHDLVSHASVPTAVNVVITGKPSPFSNLSLEKLSMGRTRVAVGEAFTVTARVRNTGDLPRETTALRWEIDGQATGESQVAALEPDQSADIVFETACDRAGVFLVSGRFTREDDLPGDNAASLVVESLDRMPILVCRNEADLQRAASQPDFLKAALGRGPEGSHGDFSASVFDPTFAGIETLAGSELSQYRCIVLDDVLPTSPDVVDRLFDFTARGGGLWLILGENVTSEKFNSLVFRDGGGLLPLILGSRVNAGDDHNQFFSIHPPDGPHPATILLGDTERLDIDDVRINQRWQLSIPEAADDVAVLLETGDGAPLAVEHLAGDGRIIVQAIPSGTGWSNLPLCQVFVPLVHEWIWYLTEPTAVSHNLDPGQPIVASPSAGAGRAHSEVRTPLEETIEVAANGLAESRFRETGFPGDYFVTIASNDGPGQRIPFVVRRDPEESRLMPLSVEQIALVSQSGGARFLADGLTPPENGENSIRYLPFWNYVLVLLAACFVTELVWTTVLTKRRAAC